MLVVVDARTATDHFPGIGRYVTNLARALFELAPAGEIALLYDPSAPATRLALPAGAGSAGRLACPDSPFSIRQQRSVPQLLRHSRATLYHSPYYLMPYRPGVPAVLTCYDLIPLLYPEYYSWRQRIIYRLAHTLALRTARTILAISAATRTDLLQHFGVPANRILVTPLAADRHFRPQPAAAIAAMRDRYALPAEYVLYVGSNKPHKNLLRLLEAWAGIAGQAAPAKLVIAGQWDERYPQPRQLGQQRQMDEQVVFLGPVAEADLPALYAGASLFVFPSLYEGFGLPVLEAMACGTPVACANTSSLPEVAGDAALTFDPRQVAAIETTLGQALADAGLRRELRQRGLARAADFSWERCGQETLTAYRIAQG